MKPSLLQISDFQPGDIIRHALGSEGMVVTANYGSFAIAVRTVHISNPAEWQIVQKAGAMVRPHRVQLSRKKGWRKPENTVVVSRPCRWGNPYAVLPIEQCRRRGLRHAPSVEFALHEFVWYLHEDPAGKKLLASARKELRGKNLACWCGLDQPCHADIWLELVNAEET